MKKAIENIQSQILFDSSRTPTKLLAKLLARQLAARWMRDPHTAFITQL